jgi:putative membrane-bound dehydrogenase-like protein
MRAAAPARPTNVPSPPPALVAAVLVLLLMLGGRFAAAGDVTVDGRVFTIPDGFVLERVAGPPLVDRPIVGDLDEQGRLYVADSSGSNDPVQKQLADRPHRILRLEDTDGDGRFDRRTVFADRMMFPEGAMWFDGSLYVSAPPSIWKLTDTDGDGVADRRVEWFQGKTLTGCANDLHGPYLGPDGWIYWAKGAFAQQSYERPGKAPFVTRAAHFFRCQPDGTGIEPVMTGGMDNPVDMVFTPGGERVFTCTFLQSPAGGRRDGLIHAIYGGVYGKVNGVLDGHPRTGPELMPVLVHLGPAAPCGFTRYDCDAFGPGYRDNLFACSFNLKKVTRHVLTPRGASFESKDEDFLVGKSLDFHPTDVLDDADGSLLVIDTGGWYKLCCPSSQLWKPDVLGAIYRVRRAGAAKVDDPRGLRLTWEGAAPADLAARLDDVRPAVRRRAVQALAKLGERAVPALAAALKPDRPVEARRNAVWASARIDGRHARALAREALGDLDETVRQAAAHTVSVRLDHEALAKLESLLLSGPPQNGRVAAEAIGRLGDSSAVPALLTAAGHVNPDDRALEHSITYALIEIADPKATATSLASQNPSTRRAALVALDQMGTGLIGPDAVTPALISRDRTTRAIGWWVAGRHPEWADALAGFFRARLGAPNLTATDRDELADELARFGGAAAVQGLMVERLRDAKAPITTRQLVLRAMARSGLKEIPKTWLDGLNAALRDPEAALVREGVAAARAVSDAVPKGQAGDLAATLVALGNDVKVADDLRIDALSAVPGGLTGVNPGLFVFLRDRLGPDNPVALRGAAAGVLGRAALSPEQLAVLTDSLKVVGPLEVDRLLAAFERSTDQAVGLRLIAALRGSPALGSLRVDMLKPRLDKYDATVRRAAEPLYAALNVDAAKQKARLESLLPTLAGGDIRRGQEVFNGTKAACFSCHAIGYRGGNVGPDLTKIGQVRTERDLLESILFPSLSFVRSFEPVTVATADGKVYNGLLKKDASDEIVLTVNATEEARIPRAQIEELRPGTVSVMPAGLDQQLTPRELADLVAFLKSRQ